MGRRSKLTAVLGLALLAVGAVGAVGTLREGSEPAAGGGASVLYAEKPIAAGTTGAAALQQGLVKTKTVSPDVAHPEVIVDTSQLVGTTSQADIPAGRILTRAEFPPSQTRIGNLQIPRGKTALALQMGNVPGVAGFAGAGDRINVYGATQNGDAEGAARAQLVLQGVEVLKVNGTTLPPAQGEPDGPDLVFLVAVSPAEAERLVYLMTFEKLYFSLVPKDQPPVPPTPGFGAADALKRA
ncbi:MAG TPA: Flp pilus assembly protein CpaB [Acidimicrobiales bacterium]|nr:Flp pilus assembly protein CpaB [Acidimicrobiales bacterium]